MKKLVLLFFILALFNNCSIAKKEKSATIFMDDFSKGLTTAWTIENHTFENNLAHFSPANVKIVDDKLLLSLNKTSYKGKNYAGAEIRSKMQYLYGRFEARMKSAAALGCITAFFLYQPTGQNNHEIDVEISGKFPNTVTLNHWIDKRSHVKDMEMPFDTTTDFHDYTIIWEPKKITWQVDGEIIYTSTTAVPNRPMHVVFNLWATKSTKWAGDIGAAKLPATVFIDHVKFYPYQHLKQ